MAWTLKAHVEQGLGLSGGTTSAIDTTGADVIVAYVAVDASTFSGPAFALTDSKSNSYTPLSPTAATTVTGGQFFYALTPTVGTGHTFTVTPDAGHPTPGVAICVVAYAGANPGGVLDTEVVAANDNTTTGYLSPGTIVPVGGGELFLAAATYTNGPTGASCDSSFTQIGSDVVYSSGNYYGCTLFAKVQTTPATETPTISFDGGSSITAAAALVALKSTVTGGSGTWATPIAHHEEILPFDGGTTSAIDTTGAHFIAIYLATDWGAASGARALTLTDNKGNTYTQRTAVYNAAGWCGGRWWYVTNPTVGTGHTFTVTGTTAIPTIMVVAFAAPGAYDTEQFGIVEYASATTTVSPSAALTPTLANELILCGVTHQANSTTINSSFTKIGSDVAYAYGVNYGAAFYYKIQTTATAESPTVTFDTSTESVLAMASFAAFAAGSGTTVPMPVGSVAYTGKYVIRAGPQPTPRVVTYTGHAPTVVLSSGTLPSATGWMLECQFTAGGAWTDITTDLVAADPVHYTSGNPANGPADNVAQPGTLEFSLRNDEQNSAQKVGYYSPGHVNCRTGFTFGIPVRLRASEAGAPYDVWWGRLRRIEPLPGMHAARKTLCTAQDYFGDLAEAAVRAITPQVGQQETFLIDAVLAALPPASQPFTRLYDLPLDTIPYAFNNLGGGIAALAAINDVVVSTAGLLFQQPNGWLRYLNRYHRQTVTPSFAFDDLTLSGLVVENSLAQVYNRVRLTCHPKEIDATATTVLFKVAAATKVPAGQTLEIWGSYTDPNNTLNLIGGTELIDGTLTSADYVANSAEDGTGADLVSSVTVVATGFAADVKFTITNNATWTDAWVIPQIRGKGIYDPTPITVESYVAMPYGDRPFELDLPYREDLIVAQDLADYIRNTYSGRPPVTSVSFDAPFGTSLRVLALTKQIGDVVTVTESVTGMTAVPVAIHSLDGTIVEGRVLRMTWGVSPASVTGSFLLDDPTWGTLDAGVLGYG